MGEIFYESGLNELLNHGNELSKDVLSLTSSIKGVVNDLTTNYLSDNNLDLDLSSIDKLKLAIKISPDKFRQFILTELSNKQALTNGQEGEIYKLEIGDKNYVVAKKRFDNKSKEEVDLHNEAFNISKTSNSGVKVPEIFHEFSDENNGYIVMEYIEGKTFYTMIWQEMVNSQLIPLVTKILNRKISEGENNFEIYFSELGSFKKQYGDGTGNGNIIFNNDYESINGMRSICSILYDLEYLDGGFDSYDSDSFGNRHYKVEQKLLKEFLGKIKIFEEGDKKIISHKLTLFLKDLHNKGFYHRDLGKKFRNIMINGNDVYVIDFGRSVKDKGIDYDYENLFFTKDQDIIANINRTNTEKSNLVNDLDIDYDEIISYGIENGLNISQREIDFYSTSKNTNLEKVLDDFINGNDNKYDWFIYFTNKPGNKDFNLKEKSTNKGRKKLFILLNLIEKSKIESLKLKINLYLQEEKTTKRYKYAKLFQSYIKNF